MGLDVYLYTKAQAEANAAHDKAWEDYENQTFASDAERKAYEDAMPGYEHYTSVTSEKYPGHLFGRRYLRSSYNGGGFNNAVPSLLRNDHGLYWIFEPMGREWDGDKGTLTADDIDKLSECKARALQVADELRKSDRLRVLTVAPNMFRQPPTISDDEALARYREKLVDGRVRPDGWWSSAEMDVFGDGLTVLAAIPGRSTFDVPGVHLIYRQGDEGIDSYIQSAEIVAEFCDEAIALIREDGGCSMSWSG
jgi:hypothetical protein